jgi:hypothetical protein
MARTREGPLPAGSFLEWLRSLPLGEPTRVPAVFLEAYGSGWISAVISQKTRGKRDAEWRWMVTRNRLSGHPYVTRYRRGQ